MAASSITSNTNAAPTSFSFSSAIKAGSSMQSNFTGHDLDMRLNRERSSDTSEKIVEAQCVSSSARDGGAMHSVLNAQKVGNKICHLSSELLVIWILKYSIVLWQLMMIF